MYVSFKGGRGNALINTSVNRVHLKKKEAYVGDTVSTKTMYYFFLSNF